MDRQRQEASVAKDRAISIARNRGVSNADRALIGGLGTGCSAGVKREGF